VDEGQEIVEKVQREKGMSGRPEEHLENKVVGCCDADPHGETSMRIERSASVRLLAFGGGKRWKRVGNASDGKFKEFPAGLPSQGLSDPAGLAQ
jgi:hypothetical protein